MVHKFHRIVAIQMHQAPARGALHMQMMVARPRFAPQIHRAFAVLGNAFYKHSFFHQAIKLSVNTCKIRCAFSCLQKRMDLLRGQCVFFMVFKQQKQPVYIILYRLYLKDIIHF